jgi:tRNA wybutosine-synthesizing protein 3
VFLVNISQLFANAASTFNIHSFPQILHILTASLTHAQKVLTAALTSGFRESGAINIASTSQGPTNPMVAVRSSGLAFDCIIGYLSSEGAPRSFVSESHLRTLVEIANDRFQTNSQRIERFRASIRSQNWRRSDGDDVLKDGHHAQSRQRRERKRAEGLMKQKQARDQRLLVAGSTATDDDIINLEWISA